MYDDLKTLAQALDMTVSLSREKVFQKYKKEDKFVSITFEEFSGLAESMASFLFSIGIKKGDKVGIISENLYKWLIADMGVIITGAIDVPRGSDSTPVELEYILKHADVKYCFVENDTQKEKILSIKKSLPLLKNIIVFNRAKHNLPLHSEKKADKGVKIFYFDDVIVEGKKLLPKYKKKLEDAKKALKADDIVTIIYTSGTTGIPKGVMLTHKNILHNVKVLPDVIDVTRDERWLSVLPVWHVFERTLEYVIMATGGVLAYSKPNAKHLLPDFQEIKPTLMVAVPRVWESLCDGVENRMKRESRIKYLIFLFFINIGIIYTKAYKELQGLSPIFKKPSLIVNAIRKLAAIIVVAILYLFDILGEMIIYKKIRELTGGVLRCPISGGGALPEYVDNFFAAIKMDIHEGWGLTETAPVNGVRSARTRILRTVGPLAPGVSVRICDKKGRALPNQSEKGIVHLKGDNIMLGYYKAPEKTKEVLSKDGWFNTGDLGRLTINGSLQLCGRMKDTIVLIGGENIEPEPIENMLIECDLIYQVMVVGQDKKVLGALIVPDFSNLEDFAKKAGIAYANLHELCKNPIVLDEYKKEIKSKVNSHHGFRDYERITYFRLLNKEFVPGQELTYSLKMKRDVITEQYKKTIEKMFA